MEYSESLGISVDIGTTNITLHLVDMQSLQVLKEIHITNPQREFGEEIISRMDLAKDHESAQKLTSVVRRSIDNAIQILTGDRIGSVTSITIVGNTAMHHLFFDLPTDSLLKPPYEAENKDAILTNAIDVGLQLDAKVSCYSPPIIESYVGSDAIAMMITSGFPDSQENIVSVDVGTNTEIALLVNGNMWVASAASGPAFEGMSIQCGMPGDLGAIYSIEIQGLELQPMYRVIGDGKPSGLCGTGAVSAIAGMLDTGILLPRGSFDRTLTSPLLVLDSHIVHYILVPGHETATGSSIVITQPDVRMLQQSKAAIRGAFELLLDHAKVTSADIEQLNLTGVFGSDLSLNDAVRIGLFPELPSAELRQIVGGAVKGADLLHRDSYRQIAEQIAAEVTHVNLTDNPDFKAKFAQYLKFPSR
ncbi:MAG: ASKHA domain-containing protein [Candidatus Thorarchaeota archaeon]